MNALPWVLNGIIEAWVSVKRVSVLLDVETVKLHMIYDTVETPGDDVLVSKHSTWSWTNDTFKLKELNFKIKKGQLVGVIGDVGSGKSSLLLAVLGELEKVAGKLEFDEYQKGFGVVLQDPWIQHLCIAHRILRRILRPPMSWVEGHSF